MVFHTIDTLGNTQIQHTALYEPIISSTNCKQRSWIPDTIPLLKSNKGKVVKSDSQSNLRDVIVNCLKVGLNHFETARFYGSSECQFVDALAGLIEDGTIARGDFIFQTKLFPMEKRGDFEKQWEATW